MVVGETRRFRPCESAAWCFDVRNQSAWRGLMELWTRCLSVPDRQRLESGVRGQFRLFGSLDLSPRCLIGGPWVEARQVEYEKCV